MGSGPHCEVLDSSMRATWFLSFTPATFLCGDSDHNPPKALAASDSHKVCCRGRAYRREQMHGKNWDRSSTSLPLAVTHSLGRAGDRAFSPVCTQIAGKPQALPPQGVSSGGKAEGSSAADSQTIRLADAWAICLISHGSVAAEGALYWQIWQSYCQGLFHLIAELRY